MNVLPSFLLRHFDPPPRRNDDLEFPFSPFPSPKACCQKVMFVETPSHFLSFPRLEIGKWQVLSFSLPPALWFMRHSLRQVGSPFFLFLSLPPVLISKLLSNGVWITFFFPFPRDGPQIMQRCYKKREMMPPPIPPFFFFLSLDLSDLPSWVDGFLDDVMQSPGSFCPSSSLFSSFFLFLHQSIFFSQGTFFPFTEKKDDTQRGKHAM